MDHKTLYSYIEPVIALTDDELALLMSCAKMMQLKKGEQLLKEGEVCSAFYLVETGYLRTYYDRDSVAINMNFTFEGDFTANLKSYRDRKPSETIIEAGEDSIIWIFNLREIAEQYDAYPQVSRFIRRLAITQLLTAQEHSALIKLHTPAERYRHIEKNSPQLLQRVSLSQLASYLGVTRETLSRVRAKNN
ncbi:Crp/Fnr family transcriptional regulator [Mucilaginibacter sp. X4EP1]|uniref:Crp/Fnr family transcriptional regulator n=1 Tax=Mucilaginibacter sp. X4EP1 TaxID=2723092 RepID=UPI002169258E|nr:Crp/Fnr family transcriptional regulator [Mucilaginibacter sp. X4EP1]MCS3814874.1 CRP-like cAMP-binding protein [Mucilaginibacter sp. X4EP1]